MATIKSKTVILHNVRLSFPHIFKRSVYNGVEGKFEATFLINKQDVKNKAKIDKGIEDIYKQSNIRVQKDKICLKDGDDHHNKDYHGYWYFKASTHDRPVVQNRNKTPLAEGDNVIYAGCFVNVSFVLWFQNNPHGKRINAGLNGVQFVKDGERFGGSRDASDDFEDLDEGVDIDTDEDQIPF